MEAPRFLHNALLHISNAMFKLESLIWPISYKIRNFLYYSNMIYLYKINKTIWECVWFPRKNLATPPYRHLIKQVCMFKYLATYFNWIQIEVLFGIVISRVLTIHKMYVRDTLGNWSFRIVFLANIENNIVIEFKMISIYLWIPCNLF